MSGLIPQGFIDDLLSRINLVDVIDRRVALKKAGRNYTACCPFHKEKTPSFSVSVEKQFYHCFGCGANGNAIGFLMAYEGLDFPTAVDVLAESVSLVVPREKQSLQLSESTDKNKKLILLLKQAAHFYQQSLQCDPQASEYLKARGVNPAITEEFCIGYAPAGWDVLKKNMLASGWLESEQIDSGMLINKEGDGRSYDRFRDRIMFPIRDVNGRYIAFGGRSIGDGKPKYLNSPETPVFSKGRELYGLYEANLRHKGRMDQILVVEGYMDVVALTQYGFKNAVASLGTAIGSAHIEKAFRYCNEIVFCFDGDEAGRRAAEKALEASLPMLVPGKSVKFLLLAGGEDPDSYLRERGHDAFLAKLEMAKPLSAFLFEKLGEKLALDTAEGRSSLITRALPELSRIPEGAFRRQLFMELALRGQSDLDFLEQLALGLLNKVTGVQPHTTGVNNTVNPIEKKERILAASDNNGRKDYNCLNFNDKLHSLQAAAAAILVGFPDCSNTVADFFANGVLGEKVQGQFWLLNLARLIAQNPGASPSRLLGIWHALYGCSEYGEVLAELLDKEQVVYSGREGAERQLEDILARLQSLLVREIPLNSLIALSRERILTLAEKQELQKLLTKQ